ncbi:MAG: multicopper oxidase domain-containing protein [Acidobacteriota bacterium]
MPERKPDEELSLSCAQPGPASPRDAPALASSLEEGSGARVADLSGWEREVSEPLALSRRTLLAAGVGLAAAACGRDSEPEPPATPELPPALQKVRDSRKVVGRVAAGPEVAGESFPESTPSYFPQPGEMSVHEVADDEKSFILDVDYLELDFAKRDGEVVRGRVRAYNRHVPGPTIRCDAGDKLSILLRNNLPADETFTYDYMGCTTKDGTGPAEAGLPHGFNVTNLHTHGLHVSPKSLCGDEVCGSPPYDERPTLASDDVFITVPPGEEQKYCIVLPDFHAPGTHWYHAHKHGSTSIQVNNGLVGALIVREQGEDRILGDEPHEDLILLMQEIMEVDGGNDQLVYAQTRGDTSKFFINGAFQPRLRMQTGEIQRWRFINGTSRPRGLAKLRLVKLGDEPLRDTTDIDLEASHGRGLETSFKAGLEGIEEAHPELFERIATFQRIASEGAQPMYLIAVDGISFYGKAPQEVTGWDVAPGNRADFLVKVDEPGRYVLVKDLHAFPGTNPEVQILTYIEVTEGSRDMVMPAVIPGTPPCYLDPILEVDDSKDVGFQANSSGPWSEICPDVEVPWTCAGEKVICDGVERDCEPQGSPPLLPRLFTIDCARYDGATVEAKYTMKLNSSEEWKLTNYGGGAHPFHIHVNPFQVVEIFDPVTGETQVFDPDEALWQDVVAIPPANPASGGGTPGYVKIRQRYLTFPGDFVIHCHFLNHEDLGMMKRVRIEPTSSAPGHGPCQKVGECKLD